MLKRVASLKIYIRSEPKDAFVVGKKYQIVNVDAVKGFIVGVLFDSSELIFTAHVVDSDGDAWSQDCTYNGNRCDDGEGWAVASADMLKDGDVVEVDA